MPKCWVKNYFAHGSFPEVGQKQKTEEKEEREKERERERLNNGENNGQATHGARKPPGPKKYLLVMPKYWGKQIFSLGRFP